jgi:hypothetical protein
MNEYVCIIYTQFNIHSLIVVNLMRGLIDQEVKLFVEFIINYVRDLKITSPFVFPFFCVVTIRLPGAAYLL